MTATEARYRRMFRHGPLVTEPSDVLPDDPAAERVPGVLARYSGERDDAQPPARADRPPKPPRPSRPHSRPQPPSERKATALRRARNAGRPGEVRLGCWCRAEAARARVALATVKQYASAGFYAPQISVRRVNERVVWVTPVPGAPLPVYPGRGFRRSVKLKATDAARLDGRRRVAEAEVASAQAVTEAKDLLK